MMDRELYLKRYIDRGSIDFKQFLDSVNPIGWVVQCVVLFPRE
jgi:hypothetical protein